MMIFIKVPWQYVICITAALASEVTTGVNVTSGISAEIGGVEMTSQEFFSTSTGLFSQSVLGREGEYTTETPTTHEEENVSQTLSEYCQDGNSCSGSCFVLDYSRKSCHCDAVCLILGDCCFDYIPICLNTTVDDFLETTCKRLANDQLEAERDRHVACPTDVLSALTRGSTYYALQAASCLDCVAVEINRKAPLKSYRLVSRCPETWDDPFVKTECESSPLAFDNPPVFRRDDLTIAYKNIACVICHSNPGYDILPWNVEIKCEGTGDFLQLISSADYIRQYCRTVFKPPENTRSRPCGVANTTEGFQNELDVGLYTLCRQQIFTGPQQQITTKRDENLTTVPTSWDDKVPILLRKYNLWCHTYGSSDPKTNNCSCPSGETERLMVFELDMIPLSAMFSFDQNKNIQITYSVQFIDKFFVHQAKTCKGDKIFMPEKQRCQKVDSFDRVFNSSRADDIQQNVSVGDNCSSILGINHSDYTIDMEGVAFEINGSRYITNRYKNTSQALLVCATETRRVVKTKKIVYNPLEVTLNKIGLGMSLVGIFLTWITHIVISKLRTLPGKMMMCYCFCMFTAILVFMTGSGQVETQSRCAAVGILQHYFWLSSFLWMNVFSYDISRSFSSKGQLSVIRDRGSRVRLLMYSFYANGVPGLVISTTCVVGSTNSGPLSLYGGENRCWIRKPVDLYAFYCPVGAVLLLNVAFFVRSVRSINAVAKMSKFTKLREDQSWNVAIFAKLSLIMGLTWGLFYSVSYIQNSAALIFCSTVNSLQGVFVFVAFVCTRRVMRMYKERFALGKRRYINKENAPNKSREDRITTSMTSFREDNTT